MGSMAERRRHHRLKARLPLTFQLRGLGVGPGARGLGTLKDISLGGLYFYCQPPALLRVGHTLDLAIATTAQDLENPQASHLMARGRVLRLDPPRNGRGTLGIAVSFLEGLSLDHQ